MPWYAESWRLSLLGVPFRATSPNPIFQSLFGSDPAEVNQRPAQQIVNEAGLFKNRHVTVLQHPGRVDVVFSDEPTANTTNPFAPGYKQFFWVDAFDHIIEDAHEILMKLLSIVPDYTTVATAPTLIMPQGSALEGRKTLAALLRNDRFDPEIDTQVFWQVNRPYESRFVGKKINRISKWQAIAVRQFPVLPTLVVGAVHDSIDKIAVRVELDFSADLTRQDLNDDLIKAFSGELSKLLINVAKNGDVR